jgi:hypothetical protein
VHADDSVWPCTVGLIGDCGRSSFFPIHDNLLTLSEPIVLEATSSFVFSRVLARTLPRPHHVCAADRISANETDGSVSTHPQIVPPPRTEPRPPGG